MPQFKQIDVFLSDKYHGNPVAVFFDADDLSTEQMAQMAYWTNLSEATFVLKPTHKDASYKVRIFALNHELPFAGHPTIGTCHALLEAGLIKPQNGKVYQECEAGLVELTVDGSGVISFQLPRKVQLPIPGELSALTPLVFGEKVQNVSQALLFDVGPKWLTIRAESADTVLLLEPKFQELGELSKKWGITGVQVIGPHKTEGTYELRTFCPAVGANEDPVCGSGSAAAGAFLAAIGESKGVINIIQGTCVRRAGRVRVTTGEQITVGGPSVTTIEGKW